MGSYLPTGGTFSFPATGSLSREPQFKQPVLVVRRPKISRRMVSHAYTKHRLSRLVSHAFTKHRLSRTRKTDGETERPGERERIHHRQHRIAKAREGITTITRQQRSLFTDGYTQTQATHKPWRLKLKSKAGLPCARWILALLAPPIHHPLVLTKREGRREEEQRGEKKIERDGGVHREASDLRGEIVRKKGRPKAVAELAKRLVRATDKRTKVKVV